MILWYADGYRAYATCILIVAIMSSVLELYDLVKNLRSLKKMAKYSCPVNVVRKDQWLQNIDSSELIPGDIIEIPEGAFMPCDLVLMEGSCVVNESMLTGESIPVIKSALPHSGH